MKKIYAKPSTLVVTITNVSPIAISLGNGDAVKNANTLSREERGSSWEDDED